MTSIVAHHTLSKIGWAKLRRRREKSKKRSAGSFKVATLTALVLNSLRVECLALLRGTTRGEPCRELACYKKFASRAVVRYLHRRTAAGLIRARIFQEKEASWKNQMHAPKQELNTILRADARKNKAYRRSGSPDGRAAVKPRNTSFRQALRITRRQSRSEAKERIFSQQLLFLDE